MGEIHEVAMIPRSACTDKSVYYVLYFLHIYQFLFSVFHCIDIYLELQP